MRLSGTLRTWKDDRGFGFIAPTHGGADLFVHISALPRDGSRPTVGERVTYELGRGSNGKPQAMHVERTAIGPAAGASIGSASVPTTAPAIVPAIGSVAARIRDHRPPSGPSRLPKVIIVVLLLGALAAFGVHRYQKQTKVYSAPAPSMAEPLPPTSSAPARTAAPAATAAPATAPAAAAPTPTFRCDGRKHCSQMTSCAEAKFFLRNCPDPRMDGDHNGIPCEQQWCTGPFAK